MFPLRQVARSSCPDFHIRVADCAATGGDCLTNTKGTSRSKALAILSDKPYKTKRKLRFRERHSLTSVFQDDAAGRRGTSIGSLYSTELSGDSRVFAAAKIVIDRLFECGLQLSQGLSFIAHQGTDELEPAK